MLLAIDVGNTQTVFGIYQETQLQHCWRVSTNKVHTADELRVKLMPLLGSVGISADKLGGVVLASVVPTLTKAWSEVASHLPCARVLVVSAHSAGGLFETDYPHVGEVGADRIADVVAARALYGCPVVVVDFGTATNMEVVDAAGCFVGGVIAPGIETAAGALFERATKLGAIELLDPQQVIGRSTEQAMQAGILYGEVDRTDGLIRRIFQQLGYRAPVVATGGLAPLVAASSQTITCVNTHLTLEGLRLIFNASA